MALRQDGYVLEQQIKRAERDRAAMIAGYREIQPTVKPTEARLAALERENAEQKESILMMARALDRMADSYEHLAERLTGYPVEHTAYATAPNEDTDTDARFV